MNQQIRRFALYMALGLTAAAVLFPPFDISIFGMGRDEYGFIFSGPPTGRQAEAFFGKDAPHFSIDIARLAFELVAIWGVYFALRRTILRPTGLDP
jgi:hypothetical protein